MAMEFYNFWNPQTYHFFKWATEPGNLDLDKLIAEAFDQVESDPSSESGEDTYEFAKDNLAHSLGRFIVEKSRSGFTDLQEEEPIGEVNDSLRSLFGPILSMGISDILCGAVAEAILRQANRWAPEED